MARTEAKLIHALDNDKTLRRATAFVTDDFAIKLTRQRKHAKRARTETFLLTCGKPNFAERAAIKAAKRKGVKLGVVLQGWPVKRGPRKAKK